MGWKIIVMPPTPKRVGTNPIKNLSWNGDIHHQIQIVEGVIDPYLSLLGLHSLAKLLPIEVVFISLNQKRNIREPIQTSIAMIMGMHSQMYQLIL
jgi:hypothetical protein